MSQAERKLRAFVVDDEELAVKRLNRLLDASGRVDLAGSSTDPADALEQIPAAAIDVLFLDIQMPGMTGFELLSRLDPQPLVVFTTAYDQYALRAFEVNSIDYLLKPIEPQLLERALNKLDRIRRGSEPGQDVSALMRQLAAAIESRQPAYPTRISSRTGERVEFLDLSRVTHFFSKDKLTYAAAGSREHVIDQSIAELEQKLDPRKFVRIHRATLLNLDYVHEMFSWFAGGVMVRLKDEARTELSVARDRVRVLKERLGI